MNREVFGLTIFPISLLHALAKSRIAFMFSAMAKHSCVCHVMDMLVGGRFRLGKKLGSGEFADVYLGVDVSSREEVRRTTTVRLLCRMHLLQQLTILSHLAKATPADPFQS